jgi:phosphoribosylaminoimidazole (AIR) synthetase
MIAQPFLAARPLVSFLAHNHAFKKQDACRCFLCGYGYVFKTPQQNSSKLIGKQSHESVSA